MEEAEKAKAALIKKDSKYMKIIENTFESLRGKTKKQKMIKAEIETLTLVQREQEIAADFTAHRMNYNSDLDWCRLLTKYIDIEAALLFDIAWPVACPTDYQK
jgi:hypothetical protein